MYEQQFDIMKSNHHHTFFCLKSLLIVILIMNIKCCTNNYLSCFNQYKTRIFFLKFRFKHSGSSHKTFHEKKIVRWISIQQLIICDVMTLSDVCSTNRKQGHSVEICTKNEMNHKIWFLFVSFKHCFCFTLIWKQSNSRPSSWLIIVQHAGRDRPSEYRVSNPYKSISNVRCHCWNWCSPNNFPIRFLRSNKIRCNHRWWINWPSNMNCNWLLGQTKRCLC